MKPRATFFIAALALTAWGAFAFGAVYTWAHAPLLVFAMAAAALGFLAARRSGAISLAPYRVLALSLAVLLAASVVQVIPLPASVVTTISPARDDADYPKLFAQRTFREFDAQAPLEPPRTLSVEPSRTWLGIWFIASLGLLLIGAAAGFGALRPTTFVRGAIVIGVLVAFATLVQLSLSGEARFLVYGLFPPLNQLQPSAPFINRNHTAGFLVMTLTLALGYLSSTVAMGWRRVKPEWRERVLWFASRDGSAAMLVAFSVMAMATAIIATRSRSGVLLLTVALLVFAYQVVSRQGSRLGKAIVLAAAALAIAMAANMGGIGGVLDRFANVTFDDPTNRARIWESARAQIRDFPVTGTGLNTFNVASLHYQDLTGRPSRTRDVEAHNDYLQLAAEGGLLLCIPALACVISLIVLIRRRFGEGRDDARLYWVRSGAVIGLVCLAGQSFVEFTLQMPGAATMFVLLAAIAVHQPAGVAASRHEATPRAKGTAIDTVVLVVGLVAATAAGVAAYARYGIYGDGPGGPGWSRYTDPATGALRLVHESTTSQGFVRRTFAGRRSALIEVDIDRDNDGNIDQCLKLENGALVGTGFSTQQDGIIDAWVYRDAKGQTSRIEISTQRNHQVDRWEYYKDGVVTRVAVDADGDGRPD